MPRFSVVIDKRIGIELSPQGLSPILLSEMSEELQEKTSEKNLRSEDTAALPSRTIAGGSPQNGKELCRWCKTPLPSQARVCPTCKGHQKWFSNYFGQILLVVSTCISIVLMCISVVNVYFTRENLNEAQAEKVKAQEALAVARSASNEALRAKAVGEAAQSVLSELSILAEVNTAAIGASGDINALRHLWAMSQNTNTKVRETAERQLAPIIRQIRADHEAVTSDFWGFKRKQNAQYYGFDNMENWQRPEYVKHYLEVPDDRRVVYVTQFLSDEKETEGEKLIFCREALRMESRPDVIYALCAFVDAKARLRKDYLFQTDQYSRWLKREAAKGGAAGNQ